MKTIFLLISIFYVNVIFAQTFEKDWKKFECENWTVKIIENKSFFLGKEIQSEVHFVNTKGNSRMVKYYVYKKSDIDESFKKEVEQYMFVQSCLFQIGKFNFGNFYINEYYYFLVPCHCSTKENEDCENLAKAIENYIVEK